MSDNVRGDGLFGWLGRQVGYVKKAVKTRPKALPAAKRSAPQSPRRSGASHPPPESADASSGVLYRHNEIQEAEHPSQPGVKLRRTIIDEVIVDEAERPKGEG